MRMQAKDKVNEDEGEGDTKSRLRMRGVEQCAREVCRPVAISADFRHGSGAPRDRLHIRFAHAIKSPVTKRTDNVANSCSGACRTDAS